MSIIIIAETKTSPTTSLNMAIFCSLPYLQTGSAHLSSAHSSKHGAHSVLLHIIPCISKLGAHSVLLHIIPCISKLGAHIILLHITISGKWEHTAFFYSLPSPPNREHIGASRAFALSWQISRVGYSGEIWESKWREIGETLKSGGWVEAGRVEAGWETRVGGKLQGVWNMMSTAFKNEIGSWEKK